MFSVTEVMVASLLLIGLAAAMSHGAVLERAGQEAQATRWLWRTGGVLCGLACFIEALVR